MHNRIAKSFINSGQWKTNLFIGHCEESGAVVLKLRDEDCVELLCLHNDTEQEDRDDVGEFYKLIM